MVALYLISVWVHILAAMTWVGGMFFLILVVVPYLRAGRRADAAAFLRETGLRFRSVGWICFATVFVTGSFNLWYRGVRLGDFFHLDWLTSRSGAVVAIKLALFATVVGVSAVHDFLVGPAATAALAADPTSAATTRARSHATLLGRLNAVLALALVAVGVLIVRGWPW